MSSDSTATPEASPRSDDSGMRIPPTVSVKANDVALLKLMERTGYNIIQENGQRKYGGPPPNWSGPPPAKGSEVFVGKIPRDLFEDELAPVFEKVGSIYEIRLMMDFSGTNRGYAFVMYSTPTEANLAVRRLNNYEIRKGRFIGVVKSVDNCRLFVGGLPKNKVREEIFEEMSKVTEGVVDVIVYSSVTDKSKSRGFAFVEYRNHKAAAMARRKLIPGRIQLWGQTIAVDWAEPEPDVDEETMSKVTVLYVRNLLLSTTEDLIRDSFNAASDGGVERVKKLRDFAFVHFSTRDKAFRAQKSLNHTELEGSLIEVTWAKPIDKSRQERYRVAAAAASAHMQMVAPPIAAGAAPPVHPAAGFVNVEPPFFSISSGLGSPGSPGQPAGLRSPSKSVRGRGAAGVRGVRNFLPPSPAVARTATGQRKPVEILHDLCTNNKWGDPQYQLHTTVRQTSPAEPPLQLFLYKVTLPALPSDYNSFQGCRLSLSPDEARVLAAEAALSQLGVPYENVMEPVSPPQPALLPRALAMPGFTAAAAAAAAAGAPGASPHTSPAGYSGAAYHLLYSPCLYTAGKVLPAAFAGPGGVYDGFSMGAHSGHQPAIY